jgi:glycosyltransferase involved in cell wall biosynthesis
MKVALVCDWFHPRVGGIELHLQDLAARLMRAGHEVVVITPTPGTPNVDGIPVHRIDAPRAPVFGFLTTPGGIRALGDAVVATRADVVHAHVSIVSPAAIGGAMHAERHRMPAVVTFHSVVPRTDLLSRALDMTFHTSRWRVRYSAVSERVARDVRLAAGASPIAILPNGIDVDFWRTSAVPRDDGVVRLISVMRLNPKKRPLTLVDMMRRLERQLPRDRRVHLQIVGDGPRRTQLARAIARAGLEDRITLLGRRTREEIRALFGASDLFVLPTIRESFGLAALEARCAGVPVVAMRASGVSELIQHGREGLLAESDEELANQVRGLVVDDERRDAMARHNRSSSPACDWENALVTHLALYREAIALRESV